MIITMLYIWLLGYVLAAYHLVSRPHTLSDTLLNKWLTLLAPHWLLHSTLTAHSTLHHGTYSLTQHTGCHRWNNIPPE